MLKKKLIGLYLVVTSLLLFWIPGSIAQLEKNNLQTISTKLEKNGNVQVLLNFTNKNQVKQRGFFLGEDKSKLVIDFENAGVGTAERSRAVDLGVLKEYVAVQNNHRLRVIFSLNKKAQYQISQLDNQVWVTLKERDFAEEDSSRVQAVEFHRDKATQDGEIIIKLNTKNKVQSIIENTINLYTVTLKKVHLPVRLMRRMDVNDFGTPIKMFDVKQKGEDCFIQIQTNGHLIPSVYQVDHNIVIKMKSKKEKDFTDNSTPNYIGKRLSLNFQDIKVRSVLQLLADFTGTNIVVSDSVSGNITLRLNNIPWDEALDIILKTRGLDKRQIGSVLLVGPTAELATQEQQALQAKQQINLLEPLESELFQINYAKAQDVAALLKSQGSQLLSTRGSVSVDVRTNKVWVQETADKLVEIQKMIKKIDIPVRQVIIEARIVNIDNNYDKELGVRFGVSSPQNRVTGSLDASNALAAGTPITDPAVFPARLNFDLPQALDGANNSGRIAVALAKLSKDFLLDLELSAMELEGKADIIANPRLMTANQQPASIETGEEIPYQEATSSGATSVAFKKAVLSLKVTPQITPDNKLVLKLEITQDKVGARQVLNVPSIDTQKIETQVLVDNGQTVVLGGVFQQTAQNTIQRIPFLGKIPVVGRLFSNKSNRQEQKELLIFITPKIVEQNLAENF